MNQRIAREQTREFFMQIPAFIDYLPLKSHEFRLYAHYLRVCGDSGECWESVRTTAAHCNFGVATVVRSRDALEDAYKLIHTNKVQVAQLPKSDRQTIHIRIRDIWPINTLFLTMVRRHGMPSIEAASSWLLHQLMQDEFISPYQPPREMASTASPNDYFTTCSTEEQGVPYWNRVFHTGTGRSTGEQGVPQGNTCSPVELNKISINKISLNQIPINQIPLNAAAADGLSAPPFPHSVREDTRDLTARVESEEEIVWWNRARDFFDRKAMERVALELMAQHDWRNAAEFLDALDERQLANLLLWLNYANWNYENLSADLNGDIRNLPAYIRSSVQNAPPNVSQRDIEKVAGWIRSSQE